MSGPLTEATGVRIAEGLEDLASSGYDNRRRDQSDAGDAATGRARGGRSGDKKAYS